MPIMKVIPSAGRSPCGAATCGHKADGMGADGGHGGVVLVPMAPALGSIPLSPGIGWEHGGEAPQGPAPGLPRAGG